MPKNTETLFEKAIKYAELDLGVINRWDSKPIQNPVHRISAEEIFAVFGDLALDAVYFSGDHPFIQFKQLSNYDPEIVRKLHHKVWNEGRSPILAITTPTEIRLYNAFDSPVETVYEIDKLQIDFFSDLEQDLQRFGTCLNQSKIDTGQFWNESIGQRLKTKNRVDKLLLQGLKNTRELLYDAGNGLPLAVIHDLLGRSLFTLYLEDRKILTRDGFPNTAPSGVENFFDLLDFKGATFDLFDKLKEKFNGDLFPVSSEERKKVTREHLKEIRNCFYGFDYRQQMMPLWRMFNFEFIPIELISAIYEEFMSGEEDGKLKARDEGAFYTKPMLVEFILNEVLPLPDENNQRYDYKILDPSCGSGIFLVQSYKRLIARWKFANPGFLVDAETLENILFKSIYGIDKDGEAIKVAAFSLYLTFLNYLEPVEIRSKYIEHKRRKFKPLVHWTNRREITERERADQEMGNNLFQCNTFDAGLDFNNERFDLIIGNPPWRSGVANDVLVSSFVDDHELPAQIACAYLEYVPQMLATNGVIALICTAKILFNTSEVFEKFRRSFFTTYHVDAIVNLAVVRNIMFDNATAPGAVVIYRLQRNTDSQKNILYCVPKSIGAIGKRQTIIIDSTDVKYLPVREIIRKNSKLFKAAMWGGMRDYTFLNRLLELPDINSLARENEKGIGLHKKDSKQTSDNRHLVKHKLIPLAHVERYYTPKFGLKELGNQYTYFRTIDKDIFKPPVVLLKRGSSDREFCCSYADYNCAYTDRIYGLSIRSLSEDYHKALVACLNSSLANYFLFMISSVWAVDKTSDTLHSEIMSFPALPSLMSESSVKALATLVDEVISYRKGNDLVLNWDERVAHIEKQIDRIIYKEMKITKNEQFLIHDVLSYSIGLKKKYIANRAEESVNIERELTLYADTLVKTLRLTTQHSSTNAYVEIIDAGNEAAQMIVIHFKKSSELTTANVSVDRIENAKFKSMVREINEYAYTQHSESIFYRKVFRYYKKDSVYLVKPNEKRFWGPSQALHDADTILVEMINVK
jgi:type I restriction-modification system DNA methylase subunit